jgi:hypothetical protein
VAISDRNGSVLLVEVPVKEGAESRERRALSESEVIGKPVGVTI